MTKPLLLLVFIASFSTTYSSFAQPGPSQFGERHRDDEFEPLVQPQKNVTFGPSVPKAPATEPKIVATPTPTPPPPTRTELCEQKLEKFNLSDSKTKQICGFEDFREFSLTQKFDECVQKVQFLNETKLSVVSLCSGNNIETPLKSLYRSAMKWIEDPVVLACREDLINLNIRDIPLNICGKLKSEYQSANKSAFQSCIQRGFRAVDPKFYDLEIESKIRTAFNDRDWWATFRSGSESAYYSLVKECFTNPNPPAEVGYLPAVTVVGEHVFHSSTTVEITEHGNKRKIQFGGISGCSYLSNEQKLYCVSDDKTYPRVYVFNVEYNDGMVDLTYAKPFKLFQEPKVAAKDIVDNTSKTPQIPQTPAYGSIDGDFEDIIVTPEHKYIVSAEMTFNQDNGKDANSFFEFDQGGVLTSRVPVVDDFVPKYDLVTEEYQTSEWRRFEKPKPSGAQGEWVNVTKTREVQDQVTGTHMNKGIEALTADANYQTIFYANEQHLMQDKSDRMIRVVRNDTVANVQTQFKYKLENEVDNGVSAMAAISKNLVLVLERGYDPALNRVTSRIFKVKLVEPTLDDKGRLNSFGATQKTLLVDLKDLKDSFAPATHKVDNFEALAVGPEIDPNAITLFLATDNNFNWEQWTMFLTIKVPKVLLAE